MDHHLVITTDGSGCTCHYFVRTTNTSEQHLRELLNLGDLELEIRAHKIQEEHIYKPGENGDEQAVFLDI